MTSCNLKCESHQGIPLVKSVLSHCSPAPSSFWHKNTCYVWGFDIGKSWELGDKSRTCVCQTAWVSECVCFIFWKWTIDHPWPLTSSSRCAFFWGIYACPVQCPLISLPSMITRWRMEVNGLFFRWDFWWFWPSLEHNLMDIRWVDSLWTL